MDWQQKWSALNTGYGQIFKPGDVGFNLIDNSTETQQQPKRDAIAAQVPVNPAAAAPSTGDQVSPAPSGGPTVRVSGMDVDPSLVRSGSREEISQRFGGRPTKVISYEQAQRRYGNSTPAPAGQAPGGQAPGGQPAAADPNSPLSEQDFVNARQRAFLGAKDSLSGSRAVRDLFASEIKKYAGGDIDINSTNTRSLEERLDQLRKDGKRITGAFSADAPALMDSQWTEETQKQLNEFMPGARQAFADGGDLKHFPHQAPALMDSQWTEETQKQLDEFMPGAREAFANGRIIAPATAQDAPAPTAPAPQAPAPQAPAPQAEMPAGNGAAAGVNNWMQSGLRDSLTREPLNQVASWQLNPQPLVAATMEPNWDSKVTAAAYSGQELQPTAGQAIVRATANGPMGSRNGQFKPGNTVALGFLPPGKLAPLNARVAVNPGNLWGKA